MKQFTTGPIKKILSTNQGFTLIEALVAMSIVAILGFILADLLNSSFKSGDKTQQIGNIKQNGQNALNIMDQAIRSSKRVICIGALPTNNPSTTITVDKGDNYLRYSIYKPTNVLNGRIVQDVLKVDDSSIDPSLFCSNDLATGFTKISGQSNINLTNPDPVGGVSVVPEVSPSVNFSKSSQSGFSDLVTIQFTLAPGVKAAQSKTGVDSIDQVVFKTTVKLL